MSQITQFKHFKGIFETKSGGRSILLTKNLIPGKTVYGESLFYDKDEQGNKIEYREWTPKRSKLGASLMKNVSQIGMKENDFVFISNYRKKSMFDFKKEKCSKPKKNFLIHGHF